MSRKSHKPKPNDVNKVSAPQAADLDPISGLPKPFVDRILASHPSDGTQLIEAIGSDPWLSVRLNPLKANHFSFGSSTPEPVEWCPNALYLKERPFFTLIPQFHAGAFYVQEASSMFLSRVLNTIQSQLPPQPICLDLCAAPGGKTTLLLNHFAQSLPPSAPALVVANEVVRNRAWILRENVAKWGMPNAMVTNLRPDQITASGAMFDLITVDAPCSGEGMFRKDDVAIAEWTPKAAADCADRQRKILTDIWPALRTGGFLIYSTCTFNPAENEQNMQWAMETLGAECLCVDVQPWADAITRIPFSGGEGYAFYPHKVRGEGFFICLLRKNHQQHFDDIDPAQFLQTQTVGSSISTAQTPVAERRKAKDRSMTKGTRPYPEAQAYVSGLYTFVVDDDVVALPPTLASSMLQMQQRLSPILLGTPVGSLQTKGGKGPDKSGTQVLNPAPELALSTALNTEAFPVVEVDTITALKFLHGDSDLSISPEEDGWIVVSHDHLPLGFVKRIGNRLNNYYPKEWRIRMNLPS